MKILSLCLFLFVASVSSLNVDVTLDGISLVSNSEVQSPYCLSAFAAQNPFFLSMQNYTADLTLSADQSCNYTIKMNIENKDVVSLSSQNMTGSISSEKVEIDFTVTCNSCGMTMVEADFEFQVEGSNKTISIPVYLELACPSFPPEENVGFTLTELEPLPVVLINNSTVNFPWCRAKQPPGLSLLPHQDHLMVLASTMMDATYELTMKVADDSIFDVNTTLPNTGNFTANDPDNFTITFDCKKCGQSNVKFTMKLSGNITEEVTIYAVKWCSAAPPSGYDFSFTLHSSDMPVVADNVFEYPFCHGFGSDIAASFPQNGPLTYEYKNTDAPADYQLDYKMKPEGVVDIANFSIPTNGTFNESDSFHKVKVNAECQQCGLVNVTFTLSLMSATNQSNTTDKPLTFDLPQPLVCHHPAPKDNSGFQLEVFYCGKAIQVVDESQVLYPYCADDEWNSITIDRDIDKLDLQMSSNDEADYSLSVKSDRQSTLVPKFNISDTGSLSNTWLPFSLDLKCTGQGTVMFTLDFEIDGSNGGNQTYEVNMWKSCGGSSSNKKTSNKKTLLIVLAIVIPAVVVIAVAIGIVCYVKKGKSEDAKEKQPLMNQ